MNVVFVAFDKIKNVEVGTKIKAEFMHAYRAHDHVLDRLREVEQSYGHAEQIVPIVPAAARFNSKNKQYQMQRVQVRS